VGLHRTLRRYRALGAGATADYLRRRLNNRIISVINRVAPARRTCSCCGWHGARFHDFAGHGYGLSDYVCPRCGSHPRHRGLSLFIRDAIAELPMRARVLHLAPEPALAPAFATRRDLIYVSADLMMRSVAVRADATRMPFARGAFQMLLASHVLEHLQDDRGALAECARVLAPTGRALILIPMLDRWESRTTEEFGAPDPLLDDHWRIYGGDVVERIAAAGLDCRTVRFAEFTSAKQRAEYGIADDVIFVARR
jgi:SAM-dependent methyltransferase